MDDLRVSAMTDKRPPSYDSTWSNLSPDVKRRWRQNREAERSYSEFDVGKGIFQPNSKGTGD
jgi:hypothetical protein